MQGDAIAIRKGFRHRRHGARGVIAIVSIFRAHRGTGFGLFAMIFG
jgi:hypothetical protein